MTVKLGFNVDHIATIREARKICEPDPIAAAVLAELAGAEGITMHLREDKQHIQDRDVQLLRRTVTTWKSAPHRKWSRSPSTTSRTP